jgi:hypothetical protein
MMQAIKTLISSFTYGKYIVKDDKTKLEELNKSLVDIKYEKIKEELKQLITKSKFTKKSLDNINKMINDIKEDGVTIEQATVMMEDMIKEIEDDNLEEKLDSECLRYMKYSESNPAEYIKYNKNKELYILSYVDNETSSKKLKKITAKLKEKLVHEKKENFLKIVDQKKIEYKGKKIIIYIAEDNKPYFDINHIINLFNDIKSKKDKYNEYKKSIVLYDFRDNIYGGFYIKEFINQETFYKMLLHTNSIFSNKFKDNIAKILDKLTNNGNLIIKNDNLTLTTIKKPIEYLQEDYNYIQTYENNNLVDFVKNQINECKKTNWNKYVKKHVMYFFVITLEDPDKLNRILCKIGYSCNIIDRFKSLESEYKCKFYLLKLKFVHSVQDEKDFHNLLKKKYPEFIVNLKIGSHDKDETYVFDTNLYKTFLDYDDIDKIEQKIVLLEEENNKIINNYFDNIENRFEIELLYKLKNANKMEEIINVHQKDYAIAINKFYYDFMILKENNNFEFKKLEMEHKERIMDKETEQLKIKLELEKIKHNIKIV